MGEIIIASLATYGISALISNYSGIFNLFERLRNRYPDSAFHCVVCLSVWVAIPISLAMSIGIIGYLAVVGIVIALDTL